MPGMISKEYPPKTACGKKLPILSCDLATLGVHATVHKCVLQKNIIKLHRFAHRPRHFGGIAFCSPLWYVGCMQSSSNQRPYTIYGTRNRRTAFGATDFLRSNERLAALLPAAMRIGNLQKDLRVILPPMYAGCDVLSFQESVLVLAVPSSAVAAKLKGWQVESVRIKIQVGRALPQPQAVKRVLELPPTAVQAFEDLGHSLPETTQNAPLIAALRRLAEKRK
jgi:hypothetical protein